MSKVGTGEIRVRVEIRAPVLWARRETDDPTTQHHGTRHWGIRERSCEAAALASSSYSGNTDTYYAASTKSRENGSVGNQHLWGPELARLSHRPHLDGIISTSPQLQPMSGLLRKRSLMAAYDSFTECGRRVGHFSASASRFQLLGLD